MGVRTTISAGPKGTYEVMLEESSVTVDVFTDVVNINYYDVDVEVEWGRMKERSGRGRQCLSILKILVTDTKEEINFEPHLREV